MTRDEVSCGFVPLNDCAILAVAVEMGFAAEHNIDLVLRREASWSNIRDKLALGVYPVAHMLSPMAVAMSVGLGPLPHPVDALMVMNLNGNALTARAAVARDLSDRGASPRDAAATGRALADLAGSRRLTIGVPFPHSMHRLLLTYLLSGAEVDLANIAFAVAPPPILPAMMQAGEVDLFMVGEPWASMAVERGDAHILLPGASIWAAAPEKVLAARRDWVENNTDLARRLIRALVSAARWCATPGAEGVLAEILAQPRYVDAPAEIVQRGLEGGLVLNGSGDVLKVPGFVRFGGPAVNFPWRSAAMWIGHQAAPIWGVRKTDAQRAAHEAFRTDLYRQAMADAASELPAASMKVEGAVEVPQPVRAVSGDLILGADRFFDGRTFDFDA